MFMESIKERFCIGAYSTNTLKYIGSNIVQKKNLIEINQLDYIDNLKMINTIGRKWSSILLELNWVNSQTQPDVF